MKKNNTKVIFVMGVSGVGKSTIALLLSKKLNIPYFDGDDFHPKFNVDKMASGQPLNDDDRFGWLNILNNLAKTELKKNSCVIVCSALKEKYREILAKDIESQVKWVHLTGSFDLIYSRINERKNHFMPSHLLKSQFDILETPKNAIDINISLTPDEIVKNIMNKLEKKSEFGLFGLGVMGKSLSRNLAKNGFHISIFNRHVDNVEENVAVNFKNEHPELSNALPFDNIEEFVNSIQAPRKIMLMVNAGKTIDYVINDLLPYLSEGDTLIDGGNSNYKNTKERSEYLKTKNIFFIGTGVSGGEEGALKGPSIMPGGSIETYNTIAPFLNKIAAKDKNNLPCCTYIGPEGSGHFVKMVHNGIEYAEMQLLAEVFSILTALGKNPDEIAAILESKKEITSSYLLEITIDILRKKENGDWLIHKIMDKAGNKGTGNWTTIATAELGVPSSLIASALFARYASFYKAERIQLNELYKKQTLKPDVTVDEVFDAYQFSRILNHYQGIKLISEASKSFKWNINLSEMARIWTNGCIIRSAFMEDLVEILKENDNILTNKDIVQQINTLKPGAKKVISQCVLAEIPIPCHTESVMFFNAITTANSSANILQAQRDYFGAHTYQRIDDSSEKFYHTIWN
jgi:6-phosphogluconate dehydrogenase